MRSSRLFDQQWLATVRTTAPIVAALLILVLNCPLSRAQTPGYAAEFEVASIKRNTTNERMYYGLRNASLTIRNMTVMGMIQAAYGKRAFQVRGGPGWITSEGFDIDAKAERPQKATHDMLKSLLASRFQLTLHRETKETEVYSLVAARGGVKMKLSADQTEPEKGGPTEMGPGRIVGEGIPMYVMVNLLSDMLGRAVINNSGLTGKYDVTLQPLPDSLQLQPDTADSVTQADALHFVLIEAVEKQLGLKLESRKAPGEVLVIDRIEHPSAN